MSERIAIVSTSYPRELGDPAGHFVEAEAKGLAQLGHRVTVITAGKQGGHSTRIDGLEVVWLFDGGACGWPGLSARLRDNPLRWLGLASWSLRARSVLEQRGPFDRVIAHWLLPAGFPILVTAAVAEAALEIVVHGSDARKVLNWPGPIRRQLFRMLSRKRVGLRCVSSELSQLIQRAAAGAFRGPIRVLPAEIEIGKIQSRVEARARRGLGAQQRIAVVAGRLIPEKRVDCALRAAALVPELEVFVIGDGQEAATLRQRFPTVRFLGRLPRPETLTYISAADVVISASREEGAPSVVREARALGVPVVASNTGDLAQWAAGDSGLFVVD